jgi:GNAT superfamily N-acetyltransferase
VISRLTKPIIRSARVEDVAALGRLVEQYWSFEGIEGFDQRRVENLLRDALSADDRALCWVDECEGAIAGYLLAVLMFSLEHGGIMAEIDEFFVAHTFRHRGIGAALLQEAESMLQERGVQRLQLQLGSSNAGAREFYAARAYAPRSGFDLWDKSLRRSPKTPGR